MLLEIGKSYVKRFYGGDLNAAVKEKDGFLWTNERIKKAFSHGSGTASDLKKYTKNNANSAYFVEV